jgi:hypothetical protein
VVGGDAGLQQEKDVVTPQRPHPRRRPDHQPPLWVRVVSRPSVRATWIASHTRPWRCRHLQILHSASASTIALTTAPSAAVVRMKPQVVLRLLLVVTFVAPRSEGLRGYPPASS